MTNEGSAPSYNGRIVSQTPPLLKLVATGGFVVTTSWLAASVDTAWPPCGSQWTGVVAALDVRDDLGLLPLENFDSADFHELLAQVYGWLDGRAVVSAELRG